MNSIIKILILSTISSVTCKSGFSSMRSGVIIGPETRLYYLEYPQPDYLKVNETSNVFEATPAYNFYHNPEHRMSVGRILFFDIIVITDYYLYESWNEKDIVDDVVKEWNKVDDIYGKLRDTIVKIRINGVIIPKVPNLWQKLNTPKSSEPINGKYEEFNYYTLPIITNISSFLSDNKKNFENLNYNMFIFMSKYHVIDEIVSRDPQGKNFIYEAFSASNGICDNTVNGALVRKSNKFAIRTVQIMAKLLFIDEDTLVGCEKGHIMNFYENPSSLSMTWSECSEEAFRLILMHPKCQCLKNILYRDEQQINNNDL